MSKRPRRYSYYTKIKERWYYSFMPNKLMEGTSVLTIPFFMRDVLHGHLGWVGMIASLNSMSAVPASIFWGSLSDRLHKRKPFIVIGFLGAGLAYFLMGFAQTLDHFILLTIAFGFFFTAAAPVSSVLVMETHRRASWSEAFGHFNKVGGAAFVLGLLTCSGYLWAAGRLFSYPLALRSSFILYGTIALTAAFQAHFLIPEPRYKVERDEFHEIKKGGPGFTVVEKALFLPFRMLFYLVPFKLRSLHRGLSKDLRAYLWATFFAFVGSTMVYTVFPIFLKERLQYAPTVIFLIYSMKSGASASFYQWAGKLAHRFGALKSQRIAIAVRAVIFAMFAFLSIFAPFRGIWLMVIILEVCSGLLWAVISVSGSTIVANMSKRGMEGETVGLYNTIIGLAQISGACLSGFVALWLTYPAAFFIAACSLMINTAVLTNLTRRKREI